MRPPRAAPPAAHPTLSRPYSSSPKKKGGTIIASAVLTLAMQLKAIKSPKDCRPSSSPCCGKRLHCHGTRERYPKRLVVDGQPVPVVPILVFLCYGCFATWRILPAFLARCLWHSWEVIQREVSNPPQPRGHHDPPVPARTVHRWRSRLAQSAHLPIQVLAAAGKRLRRVAIALGGTATRLALVLALGGHLAVVAELLHRLAPGVRLM
jgi:hypothetical protein